MERKTKSKGEDQLTILLNNLYPSYKVVSQFHVGDKLTLDFFIYELNIGFEYDGIQHFEYNKFFHKDYDAFLDQKHRDSVKENLCFALGIHIVRISYKEVLSESLILQKVEEVGMGPGSDKLQLGKKYDGIKSDSFIRIQESQEKQKELQKDIRAKQKNTEYAEKMKERAREYRRQAYQRQKEYYKMLKEKEKESQ